MSDTSDRDTVTRVISPRSEVKGTGGGNAEQMLNPETGNPHTAHTTNPVPLIMTGDPAKFKFTEDKKDGEEDEGALCDVAPTVLALLGLPQPEGGVCVFTLF